MRRPFATPRRTKRNDASNVVRALAQRYHELDRLAVDPDLVSTAPPTTAEARALGPLQWLEMTTACARRRETWDFDPRPMLLYTQREGERPRMWVMGGSFRIDARGFRNVAGPSGLTRIGLAEALRAPALRAQRKTFDDTHFGARPDLATRGVLLLPKTLVVVGWLDAITYRADRNDGDGLTVPWRHEFKGDERPQIATSTTGRGLFFLGGRYTVNDGWLD